MRVQIPPGLRKSGMPDCADTGSGKHDGATRPRDHPGELGNFSIDGDAR